MARKKWGVWLGGILLGNLALAFLYLLLLSMEKLGNTEQLLFGLPSLFILPFFGGLAASYVWRPLAPGIKATLLASLILTVVSLAGAVIILREGVICLLIVSPLLYAVILAGALVGRLLFKADQNRLRLAVFPLLAVLALAEMAGREDQVGVVTDEILIRAPASKVWPEVTSFPTIATPPDFWLFRLGLPYPQSTTSEGDFVGANRACIFSGGAVFKEKVVELEPEKRLTFEILELPPDPELIGHLTPQRGRFSLKDNGDGTTTLTGDTWYVLHVRPLGYFDWWTRHIFRAVHLRVMEDIRLRAEK